MAVGHAAVGEESVGGVGACSAPVQGGTGGVESGNTVLQGGTWGSRQQVETYCKVLYNPVSLHAAS